MRQRTRFDALRIVGLNVVAAAVMAGCQPASYRPTQHSDEFTGAWGRAVQALAQRTPHDLDCPLEEQTFKDLSVRVGLGSSSTVGVSGCGRRATYQFVYETWVADVAGANSAPAGGTSPGPEDSTDQ